MKIFIFRKATYLNLNVQFWKKSTMPCYFITKFHREMRLALYKNSIILNFSIDIYHVISTNQAGIYKTFSDYIISKKNKNKIALTLNAHI